MILLDTHAWVWWAADKGKLGRKGRAALEAEPKLGVSDISLWEVATLVSKGRLRVDRDLREWLEQAASLERLEVIPIRPAVAARSIQLGRAFPGDPADRLIVATALLEGATLVSRDERMRGYPGLTTLW